MKSPKILRLYFNKRGDSPVSVDSGPDTREYTFCEVTLDKVEGRTVYSPIPECMAEDRPVFWIEFVDCILVMSHGDKNAIISSRNPFVDPNQHLLDLKARL